MKKVQIKTNVVSCSVCGKCPVSGYNRPHSLHRTKRIVKPNTQKNSEGLIVCTRCLRTQSKKKNSLNGSLVDTAKAAEITPEV